MSEPVIIRNLPELLGPFLNQHEEVLSYATSYLTKPGENYGSTMLALQVSTKNTVTKEEKEHPLIAKMCPPSAELNAIFQTHISFQKENSIYTDVNPELIKLQIEKGIPEHEVIDTIAKCYGARVSLDPNCTTVDADAALILENLKVSGYAMGNQRVGFDLDTAKVVLQYLSYFHALPIALRMHKPEVFAKKVLPALKRINLIDGIGLENVIENQRNLLKGFAQNKKLEPFIERLSKAVFDDNEYQTHLPEAKEPFATVVHNDFWVNNMLLKSDKNNKAESVKLLDFQVTFYHSLVHDLIFFLFTSVQNEVLKENYDTLIRHYYDHFIAMLKKVDCKLDESFSYENFLLEIEEVAPKEFQHVVIMLKILFAEKQAVVELKDYKMDNINNENFVGQDYVKKVTDIILMFVEKNWV